MSSKKQRTSANTKPCNSCGKGMKASSPYVKCFDCFNSDKDMKMCEDCEETMYDDIKYDRCYPCTMKAKGWVPCICAKGYYDPKYDHCFNCNNT